MSVNSISHSQPMEAVARNVVLAGDCVRLMRDMPDGSIDMVFADPPYNLQLRGDLYRPDRSRVDAVRAHWDNFADFADYDASSHAWLSEARRLLKPDGTIWVIGSYHNIFRIGAIMQDLGFWLLNDIIWAKTNPMPNFRGRRFTNAHETLIWAAKSKRSRYTFNYHAMKVFNDDVQMRSDWHLALCTGEERLRNRHGGKVHPTQKPESLLARVIMAATNPGELVLDPFLGTGTTAAVARKLRRDYIGIEQEPEYAAAAQQRIAQCRPLEEACIGEHYASKRSPRVPFGSLIEHGLIAPGEHLVGGKDMRYRAVVRADGSLICGEDSGSIHQIGAKLEGTQSCNGWQYWHIEQDGDLHPIDKLRSQIREQFLAQNQTATEGSGIVRKVAAK